MPRFELHTAGEKTLVGVVQKLSIDGTIIIGEEAEVAGKDVVALRRLDSPIPPWPRSAQIVLHNGDRICGAPIEIAGPFLHFQFGTKSPKDGGSIRFPLTSISVLWLRSPDGLDKTKFAAAFADSRSVDHVILRNGDAITGTVTGLDPKSAEMQIEIGGEKKTVAALKVAAVAFSTKLARARKPTGAYGHLVLSNGTRLTVQTPTIVDGILSAQTIFKDRITFSVSDVAALDMYQSAAVYLSDLKPTRYQYRTYHGENYTSATDRNLSGDELQIRGKHGISTFDKGVAVHGECTLTYALDGKYKRFECLAGLDARLGKRGSVEIIVKVDGNGHKFGDGKQLTLESGPWPIRVDVKAAKELSLTVLWGDGGNVGDHVNWADARLIP